MNENTNLTPRKIVEYLDQYIIGQSDAKRSVAVALRNRWRASRLTPEMAKEVSPKNILLIGPTGVGKTEIARRIATLTRAPFVKVEATKYTEVGYVGRDVESMIRDLAEEAVRLVKKEESSRHGKDADEEAIHRIAEAMWPSKKAETRSPMDIIFGEAKKETPMDEGEKERRKDLETRIRNGDLDDRVIEIEVEEKGNPGNTDNEQANQISMMLSSMMPKKMKKKKVTVRDAKRILAEAAADEMSIWKSSKTKPSTTPKSAASSSSMRSTRSQAAAPPAVPTFPEKACSATSSRSLKRDRQDQVRPDEDRPHPLHGRRCLPRLQAQRPHPRAPGTLPDPRRAFKPHQG